MPLGFVRRHPASLAERRHRQGESRPTEIRKADGPATGPSTEIRRAPACGRGCAALRRPPRPFPIVRHRSGAGWRSPALRVRRIEARLGRAAQTCRCRDVIIVLMAIGDIADSELLFARRVEVAAHIPLRVQY